MSVTATTEKARLLSVDQMAQVLHPNFLEVQNEESDDCKTIERTIGLPSGFFIRKAILRRADQAGYYYGHSSQPKLTYEGGVAYGIATHDITPEAERASAATGIIESIVIKPVNMNGQNKADYNKIFPFNASSYRYGSNQKMAFINVRVDGVLVPLVCKFHHAEHLFGLTINEDLSIKQGNRVIGTLDVHSIISNITYWGWSRHRRNDGFDMSLSAIHTLCDAIGTFTKESIENVVRYFVNDGKLLRLIKPPSAKAGISKAYNIVEPIAQSCWRERPLGVALFYALAAEAHRTQDGVKMSSLFNGIYADAKDKDSFLKVTDELVALAEKGRDQKYNYAFGIEPFGILEEHPLYKTQRKKAIAANGNRAFNKIMSEFDSLKIDENDFPRTAKLIKSGSLPLGTFFRKSEQYFLLNDNWPLWEGMLKAGHEKTVIELSNAVSGRTTYEKDLMSYFYFILHGLPEYLKRHTGVKWTCSPRLVDSPSELEPPADDGTGTRRERSALTPIVDNENNTVIVPYASLAMPGRQTTYCYGLTYSVLNRGFSYNGNTCVVDVEEKLNGRDDYGLMFYTLTGSAQGRGYPTFLIIFERRSTGTHVHFHRTHPSRSKDGDYNPVHNWTKVCYNWMAGNINKELIKYQQGDLVFVSVDPEQEKTLNFSKYVEKYDNHEFDKPVGFAEYAKKEKSNILGYVRLIEPTILQHKEHEHVPMAEGTYEIRQCRSWEANPKGVWSLRID